MWVRGLRLKRRDRSCRRWQLEFCSWINEESYPLGMRQAISRPPSKPVHPRDVDHADMDEYRGEGGPCKRDSGSGRPPFTRAIASRRAMLNTMRLPHGMDLASLGARLRVPLHGYVLSLLALVASLLLVWLYWNNARQRELKAVQAEFIAETDTIGELLRQRLEGYELVARGGVSLFASVDRPSAGQWQGYVDALNIAARYPDMLGLGYAPYLDRSELQELQLEMRDAGQGFYVVRPGGVRSRYGPRSEEHTSELQCIMRISYAVFCLK